MQLCQNSIQLCIPRLSIHSLWSIHRENDDQPVDAIGCFPTSILIHPVLSSCDSHFQCLELLRSGWHIFQFTVNNDRPRMRYSH